MTLTAPEGNQTDVTKAVYQPKLLYRGVNASLMYSCRTDVYRSIQYNSLLYCMQHIIHYKA